MPTLTDDELTVLLNHIAALEAEVGALAGQVDFLMRERVLHTEGPGALAAVPARPMGEGVLPSATSTGRPGR